jgi:uncharacterized repeat protein (TIGR01451 family)
MSVHKKPHVATATPGSVLTFAVEVENSSVADALTVGALDDSIYGDIANASNPALVHTTCSLPQTLPPGASYLCDFSAVVTGAAGSEHKNTLSAQAADDDGNLLSAAATATVTLTSARIMATKHDTLLDDRNNDNAANPGDAIRYTVSITNQGDAPADVTFADTVDSNTTVIAGSATASQGAASDTASAVAAQLGTLAPGGAATIQFDVRIAGTLPAGVSTIANQGQIHVDGASLVLTDDPDTSEIGDPTRTGVLAQAVLVVTKSDQLVADVDQNGSAGPGDMLAYHIIIENTGDAAAFDMWLDDRPDRNTTLIAGSATASLGTIQRGNQPGDERVTIEVEELLAGQRAEVAFQVTIASSLPDGVTQVENQAIVRGAERPPLLSDDPDTPAQGDPTVTLVAASPVLAAFKRDLLAIDADGDQAPSAGDTVRYEIVVANGGNQTATAVVLRDPPGNHTMLVAGSVTTDRGTVLNGNAVGDATVEVALSDLAPGDQAAVTFEVRIADPLPGGVIRIANQAQISAANSETVASDDPDTPAQEDPTQTTVGATPLVEMTKRDLLYIDADEDDAVSAGDTLYYVISLRNVGNASTTAVTLHDTPDPATQLQSGAVQTSQGLVAVGNAAGDRGVTVELGSLAPAATATVGFRVYVGGNGPGAVSNQAVAHYGSAHAPSEPPSTVISDDPDTKEIDDPTVTPVQPDVAGAGGNLLYLPLVER